MKKITLKSTFLPVRSKRNAFANRVGQHASIMRNQYYVNVASRWNHLCHEERRVRNYRNPNDQEKEHNDSHFCHTSQTHNPLAKRGNCH